MNGSIFDSDTGIGNLQIVNSSSIANESTVQCQATKNGTVIASSITRKVILQGKLF